MTRRLVALGLGVAMVSVATGASAGVVLGMNGPTLEGDVWRWDAAPRTFDGLERSLVGGLRYGVSGGSLEAFRNQFSWSVLPTVPQFATAVQQAFDAWGTVDPVSGLRAPLTFVFDGSTAVAGVTGGGVNYFGAEIDLIATIDAGGWNAGSASTRAETWVYTIDDRVTLTTGVAPYAFSTAITGVDLYINSNPGAVYTLDLFRRLLTHEIGHALGLGDAESSISPGLFIDDNFVSSATAATTLNNSWAALVNPFDPAHSPGLALYNIGSSTTVAGVNLLMESNGLGISAANPVTAAVPLTNDEYGTIQFLYPDVSAVPELPAAWQALLGLVLVGALSRRRSMGAPCMIDGSNSPGASPIPAA